MTVAEIPVPSAKVAEFISQATAVEQARAVAEVAAAVKVAQQFPRDLDRVRSEVDAACQSQALAKKAFYAVKNRGEGLSVHLARELASIYGNFQCGVHELRRDDKAGESEIQAFAWDVERNTRASRTFVVPHARMKSGKREPLLDLTDVYLNNQNIGARAMREVILNTLPQWLVDEAEALCRATLERGDGRPAADRAAEAVKAFAGMNVTEAQLTERIGRKRNDWTAQDLASLEVVFVSIRRGETTVDEQFPNKPVTFAEIKGEDTADDSCPACSATPPCEPGKCPVADAPDQEPML